MPRGIGAQDNSIPVFRGSVGGIQFTPTATTKSFLPLQFTALDLAVDGDLYGKSKTTSQGTPNFSFLADNPFSGSGVEGCILFGGVSSGSISGPTSIDADADFTIEANLYGTNIINMGFGLTNGISVMTSGNSIIFRNGGTNQLTYTSAFTDNTWYHAVIMRASNTIYIGTDGTWFGTTYNATGSGFGSGLPYVGRRYQSDTATNNGGRFANFRASTAAIYSTSSWTPPTEMFTA